MNIYKKIFALSLLALIVFGCSDDNPTTPSFNQNFAELVLEQVNSVRTNPAKWAEENLKQDFENNTDNGAYNDLKNKPSTHKLTLNDKLNTAAIKYAKYLAENNKFGHNENGTPGERAIAEGYQRGVGENLAASGFAENNANDDPQVAAILFIKQLIIDEGVLSLGHRKNILSNNYEVMGIGYYNKEDSNYKNYFVQMFGTKQE